MFISVDLPEPDGPMMATISPCSDIEVHALERGKYTVAGRILPARILELQDRTRAAHDPTKVSAGPDGEAPG